MKKSSTIVIRLLIILLFPEWKNKINFVKEKSDEN